MKRRDQVIIAATLFAHLVVAVCLAVPKSNFPQPSASASFIVHVDTPRELPDDRVYLVASMAQPADISPAVAQEITRQDVPVAEEAPEATPTPSPAATPEATPPPLPPEAEAPATDEREKLMQELAAEREKLRAQLQQNREQAAAIAPKPPPPSARNPDVGSSGIGTIRSLDFEGWPKNVVDEIMTRYNLRVTQRRVTSPSNQSFLSSAANERGDKFYADRSNRPGLYQVFELSRKCVATMSQLEEAEIKRRGWKPERTRVKEVRFGIVEQQPGRYDIGITKIVAEQLP